MGLSSVGQDITKRKLAEARLSENDRKTRALLDAIPDMIFRMNREGTFLDYKADRSDLYAPSVKTIIGKNNRDITPPEFADLADRYIKQTLDSGEIQEFVYQMSTPKRGLCDYEARMVVSGKDEVIAVVRDITDRKLAEDSLRLFRTLVDKSNDAIELVDMETARFIDVNERACTDLGYSRSELLNMKIFDIDPGQTPENFRSIMVQIQLSNATIIEAIHQRKDGSTFPVEINVTVVELEKSYIISIVRDITERKQAEEELKRSEKSYRTLAANLPASVYRLYLRERCRMEFFNNIIEQITGYTKDELLKGEICSIDPFILPEDKPHVMDIVSNAIKNNCEFEVEYRFIRKDGRLGYFYERGTPICGEDGKPLFFDGVIFDFTDRKLAEIKIKESEARLTDAMKIAKLSTWEYNFALDRFTFPDQSFSLFNTTAEHEGGNTMSSGQFSQKYIYPDDRVLIEKEIRKAFETPDPAYTSYMEYRVIYAPGEIGYFAANVRIEKDTDNRTIKALGVNQDITERKRMEEIVLQN